MAAQRIAGVGDPEGPEQWFRSLPFMTQHWFGLALILTLSGNLGVVSPMNFVFNIDAIKGSFQVWRVLTCFCYVGSFGLNTLISLYLLVHFSKQYEANIPFNTGAGGGAADYAFALLFAMITILTTAPIVTRCLVPLYPIYSKTLIYFVLYIWSKRNPTIQAYMWGIPIPAIYLPFAYLALSMFLGGTDVMLHGMAIGHIYYFLVDVVPKVYGKDVLSTPQFLIDWFGVGVYAPQVVGGYLARTRRANTGNNVRGDIGSSYNSGRGGGGHNWGGGGRALGRR